MNLDQTAMSKKDFAKKMLLLGIPYRVIQSKMKEKYGEGMSNNTLKKLFSQIEEIQVLKRRIRELEEETQLWKKMYFELKETMKLALRRKQHE